MNMMTSFKVIGPVSVSSLGSPPRRPFRQLVSINEASALAISYSRCYTESSPAELRDDPLPRRVKIETEEQTKMAVSHRPAGLSVTRQLCREVAGSPPSRLTAAAPG